MSRSTRVRLLWWLLGVAGLVAVAGAATAALGDLRDRAPDVPSVRVERGTLDRALYLDGELRTTQARTLLAPPVPGGSMRILTLLPTGSPVKKDQLVISFDTADQEYQLAQAQSQLQEAEYEIEKLEADHAVQEEKDKVDLLTARFDVRAAELGTRGNDLIGAVEARKNELTLEEAKRRFEELEQSIRERAATSRAALEVAQEKANKARIAIAEAERNIAQMEIRAPFDGVVAVRPNYDAGGGFNPPGVVLPDYAEGDTASPGRQIAEVLDVTALQILAKAPEASGALLARGQRAEVTLRGRTGSTYPARVENVGAVASRGARWWDASPVPMFDVTLDLERTPSELTPGRTIQVKIDVQPLEDVLHVPRQAVFEQRGSSVVYARRGNSFEAHPVKIVGRTETRAVIEGVDEELEVALVNPEARPTSRTPASGPAPALITQ